MQINLFQSRELLNVRGAEALHFIGQVCDAFVLGVQRANDVSVALCCRCEVRLQIAREQAQCFRIALGRAPRPDVSLEHGCNAAQQRQHALQQRKKFKPAHAGDCSGRHSFASDQSLNVYNHRHRGPSVETVAGTLERVTDARETESRLGWLALVLTPQMGATRTVRAMAKLDAPSRIFGASLTELEGLGLPAVSARFVFEGRARAAAESELLRLREQSAGFLTHDCPDYPQRLREIYDPPAVLWYRGDISLLALPGIAVVGTRHPTPYGSGMAQMLARELSARGLTILSGMARGVDTEAHKGALEARGKTIAVWGTGVDVIYPKENKRLAEQILSSGGCILSEFPLGTFPAPQNFPVRNRLLSGISVGVLVVEAAEHSGTRITARCAMEQNRDVYAVPGNVTNKGSWTPNTLIKQGAKLTATWEDVWEDLPSEVRQELERREGTGTASGMPRSASLFSESNLSPAERLVFEQLRQDDSVQLDELIEGLDGQLQSPEIFTALFELELAGRIRQMPGKNYVRTF